MKNSNYVIPNQFKAHYTGKFGECDYDRRQMRLEGVTYTILNLLA